MRPFVTLAALALVAVLTGIAVPSLSSAINRLDVAAAANHIIAAHSRARLLAITRSQVVLLSVDSLALTIRTRDSTAVLWSEKGPGHSGVYLEGSGQTFTFSPEGFSLGLSNATLTVRKGSATRSVVVSRLGRVRTLR